ncbi:MAG TPA: hypothetical protein VGN14_14385 [Candidatus Elarobacter sp.]|jgi:hypothetical protein
MPPFGDSTAYNSRLLDLTARVACAVTVGASPSAAAETVIGTLNCSTGLTFGLGMIIQGWCTITIGGSGTSIRLRVRQTNISGAVVADSGVVTAGIVAGNVTTQDAGGLDTAPPAGGVYVLTALVGAAVSGSTVGALQIFAIAV